ncbi:MULTISPECIES: ribulose 1,5-bisphosphate carboxylase large subunit [Rhodococcus]|nr:MULTISPECIES: ribulose 1,5-bisphosphate carboxylase large subunit [Rhodococcus]MDV7241317.1 ribulose 1,5-bisphosphate carboxylase large subunit [Rhodococcus oxybenzonivorans]MDV7274150.1 ribulose 1,5-bisphosphate carboxylase large subunit [Rhodococcus oxybenzonivorans]MDV7333597.1 ribulose 1,5-bisphosphate carboxylase large subunit [Rhodococcus oxybenzonivorans]MDV7343017.1 ribulose 1,5-bisphosphate carboxylase large subunit [Rhodococcus oxybenzonivorans]MDV8028203.1 ribulose 1,5-bisphospha
MALAFPSPDDLVRTATGVARWSMDTAGFAASLPDRVAALLDRVEVLITRIETISERAEMAVAKANEVADRAATVVTSSTELSTSAQTLIGLYEPLATKAAPMAARFVEDLSEDEIHAAIGLVNHLPELTLRMEGLLPILASLDTVSPEIHLLLEEVQGVRQAIQGVPGFKFFRKRGEAKGDDEV